MAAARRGGLLIVLLCLAGLLMLGLPRLAGAVGLTEIEVTSNDDAGPGSLRAALELAAANPGQAYRITFGDRHGLFAQPQRIALESPLPPIIGQVEIDGFIRGLLWRAYGVTVSGQGRHGLLEVAPSGRLHVKGITLADGMAGQGAAVRNHGELIIEGVSLVGNQAEQAGGAVANLGGRAWVINSTAIDNQAPLGGAIANLGGEMQLVHVTLADNHAEQGAGIFNAARLRLANSIVAGSAASQCASDLAEAVEATANLIQGEVQGCGVPLLNVDPEFEKFDFYNGPTRTLAITGISPVINRAEHSLAIDHRGQALRWDQRGNGDPRFAGGFADLGAFERQGPLPAAFIVDSHADDGQRLCNPLVVGSCPLRAALELAAAARQPVPVRFDPAVFVGPQLLVLDSLPIEPELALYIDGEDRVDIVIRLPGPVAWQTAGGVRIESLPGPGEWP
jgi:hypothetical protein